jgi:hypothetical protein
MSTTIGVEMVANSLRTVGTTAEAKQSRRCHVALSITLDGAAWFGSRVINGMLCFYGSQETFQQCATSPSTQFGQVNFQMQKRE